MSAAIADETAAIVNGLGDEFHYDDGNILMRIMQLDRQSTLFPPTDLALREPNGLLAIGGDLRPARLLAAYESGIFPWFTPGDVI